MGLRGLAIAAGAAVLGSTVFAALSLAGDSPRTLYLLHCSGCHGVDGAGSKLGRVPGLPGLNKVLLHPDGRMFLANVPGIKSATLSAEETATLLNWATDYWGDKSIGDTGPPLTADEVAWLQSRHVDDIGALRGVIAADLLEQGIDIGTYSGN